MFNDFGAANEKLCDFCMKIDELFVGFLDENNVDNPVELRAVTNFIESYLDCTTSERILRFAMNKRKKERNNAKQS